MTDTPTRISRFSDDKTETFHDVDVAIIDPVAEKKLLRKCDLHVLPPLFLLFFLAFLDRVNIGTTFSHYGCGHLQSTNEA